MKIEIKPTGEPLTPPDLKKAMKRIADIAKIEGVRVVMKPTRVRPNSDGTVSLKP